MDPKLRPPHSLENELIETLIPGKHLKGDVIDAYLRIVERRSFCTVDLPTVFCFDNYFFQSLDSWGYQFAQNRTTHVNIFNVDILFFPTFVKFSGKEIGHWVLLVVHPKKFNITIFDSCGDKFLDLYQNRFQSVFDFLQQEAKKKQILFIPEKWTFNTTPEDCPLQNNDKDCGVYVCVFAELLSRNKTPTKKIKIDPITSRKTIRGIIIRKKFDDEDFGFFERPLFDTRFTLSGQASEQTKSIELCPFGPDHQQYIVETQFDSILSDIDRYLEKGSCYSSRLGPLFGPMVKIIETGAKTTMKMKRKCRRSNRVRVLINGVYRRVNVKRVIKF